MIGRPSYRELTLAALPAVDRDPPGYYALEDRAAAVLAPKVGVARPTVHRHLEELRKAGLVERRRGRVRSVRLPVWCYYLTAPGLQRVRELRGSPP